MHKNTVEYSEIQHVGLAFTAPSGGKMRGSDRGKLREVSDALYFLVFPCALSYFLVFHCVSLYFLVVMKQ